MVFTATSDLGGWGPNDLLVLVGIHFFISGLIGIVMRPSMEALMEGIRLGTFDFLLTKPADSQLLASVQTVAPQAATDVVVGVGVVAYGMTRLGVTLGPLDIALFVVMLLAGLVIVYSFLLLLATCAFWFVKLENVLVIFQALFGNAGRWPVTIFPPWLRAFLTFVGPRGLRGDRPRSGVDRPARRRLRSAGRSVWRPASSRRPGSSGSSPSATTPAHRPDLTRKPPTPPSAHPLVGFAPCGEGAKPTKGCAVASASDVGGCAPWMTPSSAAN